MKAYHPPGFKPMIQELILEQKRKRMPKHVYTEEHLDHLNVAKKWEQAWNLLITSTTWLSLCAYILCVRAASSERFVEEDRMNMHSTNSFTSILYASYVKK